MQPSQPQFLYSNSLGGSRYPRRGCLGSTDAPLTIGGSAASTTGSGSSGSSDPEARRRLSCWIVDSFGQPLASFTARRSCADRIHQGLRPLRSNAIVRMLYASTNHAQCYAASVVAAGRKDDGGDRDQQRGAVRVD